MGIAKVNFESAEEFFITVAGLKQMGEAEFYSLFLWFLFLRIDD
jgi:hypothetical protein